MQRQTFFRSPENYPDLTPAAARIGDFLFSSDIFGWDDSQKQIPHEPLIQAEALFQNIEELLQKAGGSLEDIAYMMVCTRKDRHREALPAFNQPWLKPSRPKSETSTPRLSRRRVSLRGNAVKSQLDRGPRD